MEDVFKIYNTRSKSHHGRHDISYFSENCKKLREVLDQPCSTNLNTIYVHIPFCSKICSFCNMSRGLGRPDEKFVDLLVKNIELYKDSELVNSQEINSIYFGGGTPTTLNESQFNRIFEAIYKNFKISDGAEISIETSLSNLSKEKLDFLIKMGVNRISVGIQTFNDKGRKYFKRIENGDFAIEKLKEFKSTGLKNINTDLIYCYPDSTIENSLEDISILNELNIGGFSLYSLITPMMGKPCKEQFSLEEEYRYFYELSSFAKSLGYEFFELTKMVKDNRDKYQYIINSYENKTMFPIGPGAGGNLNNTKLMNPIDLESYSDFLDDFYNVELNCYSKSLSKIEKDAGRIQLGKLSKKYLNKYPAIDDFIDRLVSYKLIVDNGKDYILTTDGIFFGNNIYHEFFDLLIDYYKGEKIEI
ncbi:coproporphyrinogen-III oxidase family protein [Anaerococcus provencensis]|uniref:coproporphyrinogen-III oxidase family protein n=1 Tax=Anaerococcus provencensis TaxID=938293 RepID=UPI0005C8933C|nr:radical SAM protein [Anaerococcus provencensis]